MARNRTDAETKSCPFLPYRDTENGPRPRLCLTERCMLWIETPDDTERGECGLVAVQRDELQGV